MWEPPFFPGIFYIGLSPIAVTLTVLSSYNPIVVLVTIGTLAGAVVAVMELFNKWEI
jgi:hypothetical protein